MSDRITATTETFGDDTWTTSGTENVGGLIVSYKEAGAASLVSHWPLSLGGFGQ
jgi:hypothetical protein